jgi:hypothetical protein
VNNTGTLGSEGAIGGAVTINSEGILSPSASALTVTNNSVTFAAGSQYTWETIPATPPANPPPSGVPGGDLPIGQQDLLNLTAGTLATARDY